MDVGSHSCKSSLCVLRYKDLDITFFLSYKVVPLHINMVSDNHFRRRRVLLSTGVSGPWWYGGEIFYQLRYHNLNKFLAGATVQVLLFAMVNRFLRILNFRIDPAFLACR